MKKVTRHMLIASVVAVLAGLCLAGAFATDVPIPEAESVKELRFVQRSFSTLLIAWKSEETDTLYALYLSDSNNIATAADCRANGILVESEYGLRSCTVAGLTADTTYYFNVVAIDAMGRESAGAMISAATESLPGHSSVRSVGLRAIDPVWTGGPQGLGFTCADNIVPTFWGVGVDYRNVDADSYKKGGYPHGDQVREDNYALITLTPAFLETLKDGEHVLTLSFVDIQESASFVVNRSGAGKNPNTGAAA